jgi:hypothetical protein
MIGAELIQWTPSVMVWIKRYLQSSELHYWKKLKLPHSTHLYKFYQEAENYLSSSFHRLYLRWIKSLSLFLATRKFQELINDSKTPLTWTVQTHCGCITIPFECQFGCQEKLERIAGYFSTAAISTIWCKKHECTKGLRPITQWCHKWQL